GVDGWEIVGETKSSPWFQAAQPLGKVLFRIGGGLFRQPPAFQYLAGTRGTPGLRSERATHVDASIEGALTKTASWQLTVYDREDRGLIRLPFSEFHLLDTRLVSPSPTSHYQNSLDGRSRGVEAFVRRTTLNGLSGWLAYSFGRTRYEDTLTGEHFWGDWDE